MRTVTFLSVVVAVGLVTRTGLAAEGAQFQFEAGAGFESTTTEDFTATDDLVQTRYGLFASATLRPVSYQDTPVEEARFLARTPWAGIQVGIETFEVDDFDADGPVYGATLVYRDREQPVTGRAQFSLSSIEGDDLELDTTLIEVQAAWRHHAAPLEAGLLYSFEDNELTAVGNTTEAERSLIGATAKFVYRFRPDLWLNAEALAGQAAYDVGGDDGGNVRLEATVDAHYRSFYTAGLSLGIEAGDWDPADGLYVDLHVSGSLPVTQNLLLTGRLYYESFSPSQDELAGDDTFGVQILGRF
jgi:hypothetical protein